MDAIMLLCDAAEAVGGKLYVMGGGWTHSSAAGQPTTMALAILVGVEWDETNQTHHIEAKLLTEDGVQVSAVQGQPVASTGTFEVGRPAGAKKGATLYSPFTLTFAGVVLRAGGYVWELEINGNPVARTPFSVG
jgi:hypothetical protein